MIKNERQYRITKAQADRFREAVTQLEAELRDSVVPRLKRAEYEALLSQLHELDEEVADYERLKSGEIREFRVHHLDDLPRALIEARIAAGLTQNDLADRLGLHPQQVQQYESSLFANASFTRLKEIADALGVIVSNDVILPKEISGKKLLQQLTGLGFDRAFIERRLVPTSVGDRLEHITGTYDVAHAAHFAARALEMEASSLLTQAPAKLNLIALGNVRHKLSKKADGRKTALYTVYAHFLSLLALSCVPHLVQRAAPEETDELHDGIVAAYGEMSFEAALQYTWEHLGIPVLPLRLHGGFHGATWRINTENVIVLNPDQRYPAFWLNDLLHEVGHTTQEPELPERTIVETAPTWESRDQSEDEKDARQYALDTIFRSRGDEIGRYVDKQAGTVERLKTVVLATAKRENVPVDSLALFQAARITQASWWGTAMKMQRDDVDSFMIARKLFLANADLSRLCREDRELLLLALEDN